MKTEFKASPRSCLPPVLKPSHVYTEALALPSYRPLTPSSKLLFPAQAPKKQSAGEAEGTRMITHHEEAHFVVERALRSPKRVLPPVKRTTTHSPDDTSPHQGSARHLKLKTGKLGTGYPCLSFSG